MIMKQGRTGRLVILGTYGSFLFSDGAMRMLLLLHFHTHDFTALQLGMMFLLYELAGTFAVLAVGSIGLRCSITTALHVGLVIQIAALVCLTRLDTSWAALLSVLFVMIMQGMSGAAKDLVRLGMRDLHAPGNQESPGLLTEWSRSFFGSRNTLKGIGFFVGAAILGVLGFANSILMLAGLLATMLVIIAIVRPAPVTFLQPERPEKVVGTRDRNARWLELARMFLVGSRDVWFVVGVPIYIFDTISDGTIAGDMSACLRVGIFTATWIVGYSATRAFVSSLYHLESPDQDIIRRRHRQWLLFLLPMPALLAVVASPLVGNTALLIAGLIVFGVGFAATSSAQTDMMHQITGRSAHAVQEPYYFANGTGRIFGTLLSGLCYQVGGIELCLAAASTMVMISLLAARQVASS